LKKHGDDFIFHIELKGRAEELAAATYAVVDAHRAHEQTIFTSFSYQQLERMIAAGARILLLVINSATYTLHIALYGLNVEFGKTTEENRI